MTDKGNKFGRKPYDPTPNREESFIMTQEEIRNKLAKHGIGYSMFSMSVTRSGVTIDTDNALKLIDNGNLDEYVRLVKEDNAIRKDEATAEMLAERNHPETLGEVMEGNSLARARRAKVMNELVREGSL